MEKEQFGVSLWTTVYSSWIKINFYVNKTTIIIGFALKIVGTAGHGSLLLENTAGEKLYRILEKYLLFRNREAQKLIDNPNLTIGDVTTVNLTIIDGGQQINVVPPVIVAQFDSRIAMDMPLEQMDDEV